MKDIVAIGNSLLPIVSNTFLERYEKLALVSAQHEPSLWLHCPHGPERLQNFPRHLNTLRPSIQFTMETKPGSAMPFLDVLVIKTETALTTGVYRKRTHKLSCPRNGPWRPVGLWDVKNPTLSRQSAHRRWQGCQPYAPAAVYSPETLLIFYFWYSFMLEAE
jgi:hypothetical protein